MIHKRTIKDFRERRIQRHDAELFGVPLLLQGQLHSGLDRPLSKRDKPYKSGWWRD